MYSNFSRKDFHLFFFNLVPSGDIAFALLVTDEALFKKVM